MRPRSVLVTAVMLALLHGCGQPPPVVEGHQAAATTASESMGFDWNLRCLLSDDPEVRKAGFDLFAKNWTTIRHNVEGLSDDKSRPRRIAAAYLFATLGKDEDRQALRSFLHDDYVAVRVQAVQGLERLEDRESTGTLITMLHTATYEEQQFIMRAIARIDVASARSEALTMSHDDEWANRRVAAQIMAEFEDDASAQRLIALVADPVWMVREDAAYSLGMRRIQAGRDVLNELTKSQTWTHRAKAVQAIARLQSAADFDLVKTIALSDSERKVRTVAVQALTNFEAARTVPVLDNVLAKPSEHFKVHRAALAVLMAFDDLDARMRFRSILKTGAPGLRELAAELEQKARSEQSAQPGK